MAAHSGEVAPLPTKAKLEPLDKKPTFMQLDWYVKFYEDDTEPGGKMTHSCKLCNKKIKASQTYNLLRHLRDEKGAEKCAKAYAAHLSEKEKLENQQLQKCQQLKMTEYSTQGRTVSKERKAELHEVVVKMVVEDELPISFVVKKGFRRFMKVAVPGYKPPHRDTVRKRILKMAEKGRDEISKVLKDVDYVTLALDGWASRKMQSFMGLVAHSLDENISTGNIMRKATIICCDHFAGRHTAENIANWFCTLVESYGIQDKLVRVGSDSAANMLKAFKDVFPDLELEIVAGKSEVEDDDEDDPEDETDQGGEVINMNDPSEEDELLSDDVAIEAAKKLWERLQPNLQTLLGRLRAAGLVESHYRCVVHWLQLAVKDFLKDLTHRNYTKVIEKAQSWAKSVRKSIHDMERCREANVTIHAMNQTRWMAMLKMILSILKFNQKGDMSKMQAQTKHPISAGDIFLLQELANILDPIGILTEDLQGNFASPGLLLLGLLNVDRQLESMTEDVSPHRLELVVNLMRQKLNQRFEKIKNTKFNTIAALLDPRFASEILSNSKAIWGKNEVEIKSLLLSAMKLVGGSQVPVLPD